MADEQIVTNIVAKADLSSLVSQVHKVTTSLQQLQRELIASNKSIAASTKVANNAFRDTLVQSGLFSSHFINLNSDVDKFGKNLDGGRLKLKDYFSTFQTHLKTSKGLIRELAKEQVMLQNAVLQPLGRNAQGLMQYNVAVPRGLDAVKNKAQLARMEMQIFNKTLLEGSTSLINWGKNTQWAGRQLTVGLTVPLTMFGTAAAKAFREADQELTRLVKVYGDIAGTSSAELAKIRKDVTATAKELSASMGVSFKETLALAADVAATGKTGQDLISSVKETTRLAVLGEVDRQEAMKATLAIQTAFKSNTEELTESINFLNAVENQTSTTLNDLVEAIPKAGTVVKQLGGSVEDLALYLTAMREGGVNASEAANALKSGLASMINPTKQTIGVMSDFGIDIMGMVARNTGDTTGMIMELQKALEGLDPLSKARALEQMFGKFQFARMAALFNNLGKSGSQTLQVMQLMNASAGELASVAGRELALVTESASGKFKRAVESLKASLSGVGEDFLNFGTKVLNIFEKIVNFFENLPGPVKKLITLFGGITAIAGPLIMITGVLANFMGYITKGIVLMKSFFQGTGGWKLLTPEMIAAERAARMVEKSFYSDAAAANVLHTALQKLIFDYASLKTSMTAGVIPVNPVITTVGGTPLSGTRRVVDPTSPYVGDPNTRAMSHINPRDPDNPASLMGVVPGAIPVNRNIGRTPQIYMQDRLPNIEGLTSVKGISTGINAGEAARFHALMATLGMQTEAEVESLKKSIAMGGTVSKELLDTFDDVLPITARIADGAATQSAAIVAELRAGTITVEQAKARIIALNAQIEAMLKSEISLYAASKGRTIDFTKAPLMDQPVVDANGQFTLRDLYKKESNRGILEEIGRLRGVRTFGAPYSTQTTKFPRFNKGGPIESFGPNKTVVSGPASINYDDRLAALPEGGYVLNQQASMDPANEWIHRIAPYTHEGSGNTVIAEVTPKELVLGKGLRKDPVLYAAVEAANNGYNFGGQIMRGVTNYGRQKVDPREARRLLNITSAVMNDPNYDANMRISAIASDAAILHGMGMPAKEALELATDFYDQAMSHATSADGKVFSLDKFVDQRNQQLHDLQSQYKKFGLQEGPIFQAKLDKNTGMYVSGGKGRSQSHKRLLKGIGPILKLIQTSDAFDSDSKRYLSRLGLDAITDRAFARAHYKRMKSLPFQGREFLFQAVPTPREVNDFFALTEQKRYGQDLMIPKKTGRGGADSYMSSVIRGTGRAPFGRNFSVIDLFLGAKKSGSPLQKMLMSAMVRAYATAPAKNSGGAIRGYNKGGGVVKQGKSSYGERFRTRYDSMTGKHIIIDIPDGFSPSYLGQSVSPAELDQLRMQAQTKYSPAAGRKGLGHGALMAGSMVSSMAAYQVGTTVSGGNQYAGFAAAMAAEIASYSLLNKLVGKTGDAAADAAKKGSLMQRAFQMAARLPGWGKLLAVVIGVGLAVKKVNDTINNHRKTVSLAFGPSAEIVEKLNLKFTTFNDQLEAAQARIQAFRESGGALYDKYTSSGIPGITLSIKELKELKDRVTKDFPELIQMFDQAAGSEVTAKAESLKAQFVSGGMSAQEATNLVYALVSASNKATFALRAIASEGFRAIKDEATAANSALKTFVTLLSEGNKDQLVSAFDTVLNALQSAEQKLIGLEVDQYGIVDAAEAYEITLERINNIQGSNKELTGDQLEALKAQNPLLYTILGTSETLASVFAKLRMYAMGITLDFTKLDPKVAENLSVAIMKMDTFYRTDTSKDNPFASLVVEINKAKEQAAAADEQTIKNAAQKKEDLEDLIELKQKEIDAIREEADARRRALEEEQQDEDILLQIKKKQLEYNNAMASGDMVTAAQAQLDIQRLVGQQQLDLAKRAIDEKERKDVDAKEAEIEALRNRIKGLEDTVEDAQETAKNGAAELARLQDLLGRGIQAIMMGQGGYDKYEKGIVKGLIAELNKETNPQLKAIVPLLESQLKNPDQTQFEDDLVDTLKDLNITMQDIRDRYLPPMETKQGKEPESKNFWERAWDLFKKSVATSWGTPGFGYSQGGYIKGPGTGTSDSIPGYITGFADGGMVPIRVSNTEYITRSSSVNDVTVPNMDLINQHGAEGVIMAAQNILGTGTFAAATGGYVNSLLSYANGSTGGLTSVGRPKTFNFSKLDDRMLYAMKHLVSKGMTPEAAAGIVGNLIAESTLRTGAKEAGHTREGRGIAQWGVNARWKTYQNWLKKNGRKDIYDLANQLDFVWWEMHNGQLANPNKFKTLTDISKAAYLFMDQYERPGVLRWKERNTWAYKAYKQYTGKDYMDVAATLYPGPDKAISDYKAGANPVTEMLPEDPQKLINLTKIAGISKVSALGFARGGYLGFKGGSQKGLNISKGKYNKLKDYFSQFGDMSVNFQTDKHDLYPSEIQELKEIAQKIMGSKPRPSSMNVVGYADQRGSTKYNMALSRRRAKYVAQILSYLAPGINFNPIALGEEAGKYSQLDMSKKRRVSIELPPRVGGGLSLPYEPKGMSGSSPFEGIFPGGAFQGLMTLAKGGYLGFKGGGAPHEMGMRNSGISQKELAKKFKNLSYYDSKIDPFFEKFANFGSKTFTYSPFGALLPAAHIAKDLFGAWFTGATPTFGKNGFLKDIDPRSYQPYIEALYGSMSQPFSEIAKGSATKGDYLNALLFALPQAKISAVSAVRRPIQSSLLLESKIAAKKTLVGKTGLSKFESAYDVALQQAKAGGFTPKAYLSKVPYETLYKEAENLKPLTGKLPTKSGDYTFKFTPARVEDFPEEKELAASIRTMIKNPRGANEFPGGKHTIEVYDETGKIVAHVNWDSVTGVISYINTDPAHRGKGIANAMYNQAGSITRIAHSRVRTADGLAYSSRIGGLMPDYPVLSKDVVLKDILTASLKKKTSQISKKIKGDKRIVITHEDMGTTPVSAPRVVNLPAGQRGEMLEAWRQNPNRTYNDYPFGYGGQVDWEDNNDLLTLMKNPDSPAGYIWQPRTSAIPKIPMSDYTGIAKGGYLGKIRKFHDWNGPIPGAYGSEVSAILQAGREGVYDTDYVNALKNGTMNTTSTNNKNINIGSVQMTFTEPIKNGRQVFDEFKALISFENNASSSRINLGVGA